MVPDRQKTPISTGQHTAHTDVLTTTRKYITTACLSTGHWTEMLESGLQLTQQIGSSPHFCSMLEVTVQIVEFSVADSKQKTIDAVAY